jgi:hypothetical protein
MRMASPLLDSSTTMFDETLEHIQLHIHRDELFHALYTNAEDEEFDSLTQQSLELLLHSMLILLERQAQDQLPGGKFAEPEERIGILPRSRWFTEKMSSDSESGLEFEVPTTIVSDTCSARWARRSLW